ncbi:uncharacterized protein [Dermacentor albipictus]|uniref:uncharacterized protein isoform X2 n=1 Tax=Dermacentor albipictus TaxID=60249 RepID=UPI0031FC18AE
MGSRLSAIQRASSGIRRSFAWVFRRQQRRRLELSPPSWCSVPSRSDQSVIDSICRRSDQPAMYESSTVRLTEPKPQVPTRRAMWAAEPVIPDRAVYTFGTLTLLILAGALVILGYAAYVKLS